MQSAWRVQGDDLTMVTYQAAAELGPGPGSPESMGSVMCMYRIRPCPFFLADPLLVPHAILVVSGFGLVGRSSQTSRTWAALGD